MRKLFGGLSAINALKKGEYFATFLAGSLKRAQLGIEIQRLSQLEYPAHLVLKLSIGPYERWIESKWHFLVSTEK